MTNDTTPLLYEELSPDNNRREIEYDDAYEELHERTAAEKRRRLADRWGRFYPDAFFYTPRFSDE